MSIFPGNVDANIFSQEVILPTVYAIIELIKYIIKSKKEQNVALQIKEIKDALRS